MDLDETLRMIMNSAINTLDGDTNLSHYRFDNSAPLSIPALYSWYQLRNPLNSKLPIHICVSGAYLITRRETFLLPLLSIYHARVALSETVPFLILY